MQKKNFYMEKKCYTEKKILLKKTFFTEKNINENVKMCISFEKYILNFLNIYSFCKKKKKKFDRKKYIC